MLSDRDIKKVHKVRADFIRIYGSAQIVFGVAVLASVAIFIAFLAARLPEARARAEAVRMREIASEHDAFCRKWGMMPHTPKYAECVADLQDFRAEVERRIAAEYDF